MEDTSVPVHFPIVDPKTGDQHRELLINKGTPVYIGLGAANRSTAIWGPDADQFKPERWMGQAAVDATMGSVKMPGIFSNA